jgi:transposase
VNEAKRRVIVARSPRERALVRMKVEAMWSTGLSAPEIGRRLGWPEGVANGKIVQFRREGWDLPVRNKGTSANGKRTIGYARQFTRERK